MGLMLHEICGSTWLSAYADLERSDSTVAPVNMLCIDTSGLDQYHTVIVVQQIRQILRNPVG